jgi:putative phosphoribosyl transferase
MSAATPVRIAVGDALLEGALDVPAHAVGLVLFAHGYGSSRHSPRNNFVAAVLREAGIGTLLVDLLLPGEERDDARRFDAGLTAGRLLMAARWIATRPATRALPLGLFGSSLGAAAALEAAAALGDEVRAMVLRGGRPDFASRVALATLTAPTLLLVGGKDIGVARLNQNAYDQLGGEKALRFVPGASHLFDEPGTLEALAHETAAWFVRHLPGPGPRH